MRTAAIDEQAIRCCSPLQTYKAYTKGQLGVKLKLPKLELMQISSLSDTDCPFALP